MVCYLPVSLLLAAIIAAMWPIMCARGADRCLLAAVWVDMWLSCVLCVQLCVPKWRIICCDIAADEPCCRIIAYKSCAIGKKSSNYGADGGL